MSVQAQIIGRVEYLCINGERVDQILFGFEGPIGDRHAGERRELSGHDGEYLRTSGLKKGDEVFNWRSWTAVSQEEIVEAKRQIDADIPPGCLLENIMISGVPNFSKLLPTTRLVFPLKAPSAQTILAVWEENGPCSVVGGRLEAHHGLHKEPGMSRRFVQKAQGLRGVMGFVLSPGTVKVGDRVFVVYPSVS